MRRASWSRPAAAAALCAVLGGCGQIAAGIWLATRDDSSSSSGSGWSRADEPPLPPLTADAFPFEPEPVVLSASGATVVAVAVGDLDGDGVRDVVTTGPDAGVTVHLGDGAGGFGTGGEASAQGGHALALADLDLDGRLDLLVGGDGGLLVALGIGDGTFSAPTVAWSGAVRTLAVAELDRDALLDVVVGTAGSVAVLSGDGAGSFTLALEHATAPTTDLVLADVDFDADLDLVTVHADAPPALRLNPGTGSFPALGSALAAEPAHAVTCMGGRVVLARADELELVSVAPNGQPDPAIIVAAVAAGPVLDVAAAPLEGAQHDDRDSVVLLLADGSVRVLDLWRSSSWDEVQRLEVVSEGASAGALLVTPVDASRGPDLLVAVAGRVELRHHAWRALGEVPLFTDELLDSGLAPMYGVVALDLERDGDLDLLDRAGGVALNDGAGALTIVTPPPAVPSGDQYAFDLDGDGAEEVVTLETTRITASADRGALPLEVVGVVPTDPLFVERRATFTDLNRDGFSDLVVFSEAVEVAWGDGVAFAPTQLRVEVGPAFGTYRYAVVDVDGDGYRDIIGASSYNPAVVSLYDGQGGFAAPIDVDLDYGLYRPRRSGRFEGLTAAYELDADGDGRDDLLLINHTVASVVHRASGSGLVPWREQRGVQQPLDLDLDGDDDLVLSGPAFLVQRAGARWLPVPHPRWFDQGLPLPLVVADLDGDGAPEVVSGGYVRRGLPAGTPVFTRAGRSTPALQPIRAAASLDLDRDGRLDLVVGGDLQLRLVRALGADPVVDAGGSLAGGAARFAAADFDGDGRIDVAFGRPDGTTGVLLASGSGLVDTGQSFGSCPDGLLAGDVDGDGDLDLVLLDSAAQTVVWENDGAGAFASPGQVLPPARAGCLADFDGDDLLDLALVNTTGPWGYELEVYRCSPGLGFVAPVGYPSPDNPSALAAGDVDGDGATDLVVGWMSNEVGVLVNDGAGGFSSGVVLSPPAISGVFNRWPEPLFLCDLDQDGDLDVLAGFDRRQVAWLGRGDGTFERGYSASDTSGTLLEVRPAAEDGGVELVIGHDAGVTIVRRWN